VSRPGGDRCERRPRAARAERRRERAQAAAKSGPAIYFGMAPMPVALELGRRLVSPHRVLAY